MTTYDDVALGPKPDPRVIGALADARRGHKTFNHITLHDAFTVLDNAEVFKAIDEATGYDITPDPYLPLGDPAEMGDLVSQVSIVSTRECQRVVCTQHGEISVHPWGQPGAVYNTRDSYKGHMDAHQAAQAPADSSDFSEYSEETD